MKQSKQKAKQNTGLKLTPMVYGIFVLLLVTLVAVPVIAKYVHQRNEAGSVTADQFFFASDQLKEGGETYNLNAATNSITFELRNYEDLLRCSDLDVHYTVTATGGTFVNGESVTVAEGDLPASSGAVTKGITLYGLEPGNSYTVTAVGTNGFSRTLTAVFVVAPAEEEFYMFLDTTNPAYVELNVKTKYLYGTVDITFPDGVAIDDTDAVMQYWADNYIDGSYQGGTRTDAISFSDTSQVYSSKKYRFFREEAGAELTLAQFNAVITYNGDQTETAVPGVF